MTLEHPAPATPQSRELAFDRSGTRTGPSVVLLHGGGVAGWMWRPQVAALDAYDVLVPDLPGHGRSRSLGPSTVKGAARLVAQLIEREAGGGRAHLVGLSLGGMVAVELLGSRPDVLRSVAVSGVNARPLGWAVRQALRAALWLRPLLRWSWLVRAQGRALGLAGSDLAAFVAESQATTTDDLRALLDDVAQFRLPPRLDPAVPLLVLRGRREVRVVTLTAADLRALAPGAVVRRAPRGSHVWSVEEPELFNRTLLAWLRHESLPADLLAE